MSKRVATYVPEEYRGLLMSSSKADLAEVAWDYAVRTVGEEMPPMSAWKDLCRTRQILRRLGEPARAEGAPGDTMSRSLVPLVIGGRVVATGSLAQVRDLRARLRERGVDATVPVLCAICSGYRGLAAGGELPPCDECWECDEEWDRG